MANFLGPIVGAIIGATTADPLIAAYGLVGGGIACITLCFLGAYGAVRLSLDYQEHRS